MFRQVLPLHEQAPLLILGLFVGMQNFQCQGLSASGLTFLGLLEYPLLVVS